MLSREILTIPPANLVLGDDDLSTVRVFGARDGVLQEADRPDNLALLNHTDLAALRGLARTEVARVADDLLRLHGLGAASDADEFALCIRDNLVDAFVEHVGAAVDGTQTREGLRQLAEAVQGVDVRRLAVACHGSGVENNALVRRPSRLGLVAVWPSSEPSQGGRGQAPRTHRQGKEPWHGQ